MTVTITARCVACKATRPISLDESKALSYAKAVPMCDRCGSPMVADSVEVIQIDADEVTS